MLGHVYAAHCLNHVSLIVCSSLSSYVHLQPMTYAEQGVALGP